MLHARTEQRPLCCPWVKIWVQSNDATDWWYGNRLVIPGSIDCSRDWGYREERGSIPDIGCFGAVYIAYLGLKIARSNPTNEAEIDDSLGLRTGVALQIVNGKAWIHFLVLMTTFGSVFGDEYSGKVALVALNLLFGLPAVMTWAAFGHYLSKVFTSRRSSKLLNGSFGIALICLSIWIVLP